jgi:hypothetical protein
MKQLSLLWFFISFSFLLEAQTTSSDSTKKSTKNDTVRIGNIIIIKGKGDSKILVNSDSSKVKADKKIDLNLFVLDIGFTGWTDKTNYNVANPNLIGNPSTGTFRASDMKLKSKSVNVNLWLLSYKLNLVKQNVVLKSSLGVEWHNYALNGRTSFRENGQSPYGVSGIKLDPFAYRDSISFSKNKLNVKYLSVPLSIGFYSKPLDKRGRKIGGSVGVMYSRLIRQRNKQVSEERGKEKTKMT